MLLRLATQLLSLGWLGFILFCFGFFFPFFIHGRSSLSCIVQYAFEFDVHIAGLPDQQWNQFLRVNFVFSHSNVDGRSGCISECLECFFALPFPLFQPDVKKGSLLPHPTPHPHQLIQLLLLQTPIWTLSVKGDKIKVQHLSMVWSDFASQFLYI